MRDQYIVEHPLDECAYSGMDLGVTYKKKYTVFKVWAPTKNNMSMILYENHDSKYGKINKMIRNEKGVWQCTLIGNYKNKYYNYMDITEKQHLDIIDPYAKAASINGKRGMIVDFQSLNPKGWEDHYRPFVPNPVQSIIYELHVRDFSIDENSGMKNKGRYIAFTEKNTRNSKGNITGISYLKELGITHIHLLPIFDFGSIDEEKKDEYNWGYDPVLYNVPEGSYATNAYAGEVRIRELKEAIQAIHEEGIAVIMDVVYNHTYITDNHPFEHMVPNYYFRSDGEGNYTNGSGVGNETASERLMVRKYMVDSLCFWAQEYQIDGFRFDLMALHDIETMHIIERELKKINSNMLLYGEPWTGGHSQLSEELQFKKGKQRGSQIAVFNDEFRDAIKGDNNGNQTGFVNGAQNLEWAIKKGVVGSIFYNNEIQGLAQEPMESINYVSCHDNLTLFDKIEKSCPYATQEEKIKMNRLALSMILTSQGIPFLHGGSEILKSKKGHHNSYNAGDEINRIDWGNKDIYDENFEYIKGLISFRKTQKVMTLQKAEDVRKSLEFLIAPANVVAYLLKSQYKEDYKNILIVHNANKEEITMKLPEPGQWKTIANQHEVKASVESKGEIKCIEQVKVSALSTFILVK